MVVSSVAHAAVLAYALIGFNSFKEFPGAPEALPVEFITPSDFDKLTKGERHSKKVEPPKVEAKKIAALNPEPKPVQPEAKQNVEAPPPPPEPEQKVETPPEPPKPEPKKAEAPQPPAPAPKPAELPKPAEKKVDAESQAKLDDIIKKEVEKKPEPKKAQKSPEKPRPKFDPTKIAALADRRDPGQVAQEAPQLADYTTAGVASGTAQQLSLSEKSMINQMIIDAVRQCWTPPIGAAGATDLAVVVQFDLMQDGTLSGEPRVMNSSGNPFFQSAADAALRAVRRCSPIEQLPPQYYDHWKSVEINFDPREMMGG